MPSIRSILLLALPLASVGFAAPQAERDEFDTKVVAEWEDVLKTLPGDSLKAAMGSLKPKYREGVFEDGHDAIAAIHDDDPDLASKLVDLAKHDAIVKDYLRKRQSDNTTTITSSSVVVDSTTTTTVVTTETSVVTTPSTTPTSTTERTTEGQSTTSIPSSSTPVESSTSSSTVVEPSTATTEGETTLTLSVTVTRTSSAESQTTPADRPSTSSSSSIISPSPSEEQGSSSITAPVTTPTTQTGVIVPIEVSTTMSDGSVVVTSTEVFQTEAPTSIPVEVTTTNENGETITTSTMAPAAIITSTNDQGSAVTTAQQLTNVAVAPGGSIVTSVPMVVTTTDSEGDTVVLSRPTPGATYTTTDARGSVAVVTYRPGGGTVSQLRLQTTTLPNGMRSTITSYEVVGGITNAPDQASANPSSTGTPNLQSGAAMPSSYYAAEVAILIGAAIGVAGMIL